MLRRVSSLSLLFCVFGVTGHAADTAQKPWQIGIGAGTIYGPAFLGSDDYQLSVVPSARVTYKDQFFASVPEGIGYNLIRNNGWRSGPVIKYAFQRNEDGEGTFQVGGPTTRALRGLGDVDGTYELGWFAEYAWKVWSAKAEVRQGLNGHEGLVGDLSAAYRNDIGPMTGMKRPLYVSFGPRATFVSDDYNEAYFGVNASQSAKSSLPGYSAEGGLLSYGAGGTATLPLTPTVSTTLTAGYDRLSGDAGDSPLVQQRGSEDQGVVGLFVNYQFGLDD